MTEPVRFFLPGPTYVHPDVLRAMQRPVVGHRSPEFKTLYASLGPRLERVFRTGADVLISTSSATLAMESAVRSTVRSRVLNLTCGAFSERWHAICREVGLAADRVSVPWGKPVDPGLVRQALRRQRYEAVTVAHNETSTGVMSPLAEIAAVIREESDALILVDAVSSLAGAPVETDAWGLDIVITASQKALALPPGLALFTLSERAAERAAAVEHRGFYTDVLRYREKHRAGGTITTPAVSLFYALDRQLDRILEEGVEKRWARHHALHLQSAHWAAGSGLAYASEDGSHSWTVACLKPPPGVDPPALVRELRREGYELGRGYGDWSRDTFRIGHMGDVGASDLDALFESFDNALGRARGRGGLATAVGSGALGG